MSRPEPSGVPAVLARIGLFFLLSVVCGGLVAALALPLAGAAGLATKSAVQEFENLPSLLSTPPLPQQTKILTSDGKLIATIYSENRISVPLKAVAPVMQTAIVAIEDTRFYEHHGVDARGLARALVTNAQGGNVQGGSTITQQYVKNVLLLAATNDAERAAAISRTLPRKLREIRLALGLEKIWTKQQILEGYLNSVYFGAGAYGIQAAALRYFNVPASKLTVAQSATLAGIVQSPVSYDPTRNPRLSQKRRDVVLRRMFDLGKITSLQMTRAMQIPMATEIKNAKLPPTGCASADAPYFCDYVRKIVRTDPVFGKTADARAAFWARGGLTIRTTLDSVAQATAQAALVKKVPMNDPHGAAISVVQPGTGRILVMAQNRVLKPPKTKAQAASYSEYNFNLDGIVNGSPYSGVGNQTGSTFKPFVIAAALEAKIPVSTTFRAPQTYKVDGTYLDCNGVNRATKDTLSNTEGEAGTFNMLTATAKSVNTYFLQLEQMTGLCRPARIAEAMGVRTSQGKLLDQTPAMTLGANPVAPLRMAAAYAAFANHGKYCAPRAIASIVDNRTGKALAVPNPPCSQVLDPKIADGVTAILTGVMHPGGTGASLNIGRPVAGKTGTTNGNINVWFVGYTPQLAAAAWVGDPTGSGYGKRREIRDISIGGSFYHRGFGLNLPGPVWQTVMSFMSAKLPVVAFAPVDPSVIKGFTVKVPDLTGMDPTAALALLQTLGLTGKLGPTSYPSATVPKGKVSQQSPRAGSSVATGREIAIVLSSGPPVAPPPPPPSPTATPTISPTA